MGAHTSARCISFEINCNDELDIASEPRGKRKAGEKRKGKRKKRRNFFAVANLKDKGLAANVKYSIDAGGMAAADVTQASEQAKSREFLMKQRFKQPVDGCHAINMERVLQRRAEERVGRLRRRSESCSKKMKRDRCQTPYLQHLSCTNHMTYLK